MNRQKARGEKINPDFALGFKPEGSGLASFSQSHKTRNEELGRKTKSFSKKLLVLGFSFAFFALHLTFIYSPQETSPLIAGRGFICFAQQSDELEITIDINSTTIPLPKIFKPNIDLSGKGFYKDTSWPQTLASSEILNLWQKDIGFNGFYRLQYNLWEINQLTKNKDAQKKLLDNYDEILKNISASGGTVILDIFGTPAGLGKVLDKRSAPLNLKAFKGLIKDIIRDLSCIKKYNIWYEIWSAPDQDSFFLGAKQEYLNLYRAIAEAVIELEAETKIEIPLGGPGISWWFQNIGGNTIITAEKSLIYDLIKFCYQRHLPLDFITWHGFSTSGETEKEKTVYDKFGSGLIRTWLAYFRFNENTPLIVSEWNFDSGANILSARKEKSYICASFIPARIKNMSESGIDNQIYFCLQDFQNAKEDIVRNVGIFYSESNASPVKKDFSNPLNKNSAKAAYNIFKMLANLGNEMFTVKLDDQFIGTLATKEKDTLTLIFYNYIDPDTATSYLSRNVTGINNTERKTLLDIVNSDSLRKLLSGQIKSNSLRITDKVRNMLDKALELSRKAELYSLNTRNIKLNIKNLAGDYLYQRYTVDSSCSLNCEFLPDEEKEITGDNLYQEVLSLKPYSVRMIVLKKKPIAQPSVSSEQPESP
ncbi:MAG: hypothetical protein QMD94_00820 [Candidatus Omnitrophota bacterium]|nr:hypothetical protein [Candidatus Omnitrophota bacterium]